MEQLLRGSHGNDNDDHDDGKHGKDREKPAMEIVARFPWIADCAWHDINHSPIIIIAVHFEQARKQGRYDSYL